MCLAVPGKVLTISGDEPLTRVGKVNFGGIIKDVNFAYVPEAQVGDYVIVHVGFALNTVDEAEANLVFDYLREMGELADLEEMAEGRAETQEARDQRAEHLTAPIGVAAGG